MVWCGHGSPLEPDQAGKVVSEIGQADLGAGADHPDRAHNEPEPACLCGKDMLDGARLRAQVALPRAMCAGIFVPRGF